MLTADLGKPGAKLRRHVINRQGHKEAVCNDKITARIRRETYMLSQKYIDPAEITQKLIGGMTNGITTYEIDELAAETAAHMTSIHPDFGILAGRLTVTNRHRYTLKSFVATCKKLYDARDAKRDVSTPLISTEAWSFIEKHADVLESAIVYSRDSEYDYFGYKTLERSYLIRINDEIAERPQHMLLRVSCGIHLDDISAAIETYELMSMGYFTHASPTLFNSATLRPQLSSCFLLTMNDDSIDGIFTTLKQTAMISKHAGGIGLSVHNIRASGSYISGTNGTSNGLVPMLRVFNNTARYVDQGGGKRKGAFAIYLEPWHADVFEFLDLRKNHGSEEQRARDLFYALWVPDLFMRRVEEDGVWSLMCPHECPGLYDTWGEKHELLYLSYEKDKKYRKQIKARQLWQAILEAQIETGNPYIMYKDACNSKSNQQNLGTIRSSNLCTEVVQYTSPDEIAVCNLASIALPMFVDQKTRTFNFKKLFEVTQVVTRNLNKVIDINYYPVPEARRSNHRHRPIGIGVQGLADAFILMGLPFESLDAQALNREIFEVIYYSAITASVELAQKYGPYETYEGSPASKGLLQFDLWGVKPESKHCDWPALKAKIRVHGLRNSLVTAPMPTASTSQILGNNECFEPYTSNLYVRRTLAGEFVCVNKHLVRDLVKLGIWNEDLKQKIVVHNGSVQDIPEIPKDLRELYKTVWEMSGKVLINMAADRGAYIDQSQSFNVYMKNATFPKLSSMHFYGWKKGLKTGMYYLHTKPAADAIKFTVDHSVIKQVEEDKKKMMQSTPVYDSSAPLTVTSPDTETTKKVSGLGVPLRLDFSPITMRSPKKSIQSPKSALSVVLSPDGIETPAGPPSSPDPDTEETIAVWRMKRKEQQEMCRAENGDQCLSCGS